MMASKKNLSAVLYDTQDLRMEESAIPSPKAGEVLIELRKCGICGTDMIAWNEGLDPRYVTLPVVLGHECSGIIQECGEGVTHLKPGDHVAVELEVPCRNCELCKTGKYNLCKPWSFGGLQKYRAYAADFCHKLPSNVSLEQGALLEPLACGVRAAKRAGVTMGSNVLVCGAGAIGLSALLAVKATGASSICITDVDEQRLKTAEKMGATHTLHVTTKDARQLADDIQTILGGQVDYSIECSGVESSIQAALYATKSGGTMAPVGLDPPEAKIDIVNAATREVDIKGVFSYCNDYPAALSLVASGLGDPLTMVTHRYPLSRLLEALQLVKSKQDGVIKVIIDCQS